MKELSYVSYGPNLFCKALSVIAISDLAIENCEHKFYILLLINVNGMMDLLLCIVPAMSAPKYDMDLPYLRVTGTGAVTQGDIKSNGAYNSVEIVEIYDNISSIEGSAFYGMSSIRIVNITSSHLTKIGANAFNILANLEWVSLPDNLLELHTNSIRSNPKLKTVKFGYGLKKIYDYSFDGDYSLEEAELSYSLEYMGKSVFGGCKNLRKLTFGPCLKEISSSIISGTSITEIYLPKSFSTYHSGALSGCTVLTSIKADKESTAFSNDEQGVLYNKEKTVMYQVPSGISELTIPTTVRNIYMSCIYNCPNIRSIEVPSSIEKLNESSISSCNKVVNLTLHCREISSKSISTLNSLNNLVFGDSVEVIRSNAFTSTSYIQSISFGKNVKMVEKDAFADRLYTTNIFVNSNPNLNLTGGVLYLLIDGKQTSIILVMSGATSIHIGPDTEDISLKAISIPTLETITVDENNRKYKAFSNALYNDDYSVLYLVPSKSLELTLHENTKNVTERAAYYSKISKILLNEGLEYINDESFRGCGVAELILPSTLLYTGQFIFSNCVNLIKAELKCINTSFGSWLFYGCTKLSEVVFSENCNISFLPSNGFQATNVLYVELPKSIEKIKSQCFRVSRIQRVSFPYGSCLEEIEDGAFLSSSLTSFEFPVSLKKIHAQSFQDSSLEELVFDVNSQLNLIRNQAFMNTPLKKVCLPNMLKTTQKEAFKGVSIKSIIFPSGLETIGESAFSDCSFLTNVTFPDDNNLTEIYSYAFSNCNLLATVNLGINSKLDTLMPAVFSNCFKLKSFKIPDSVQEISTQTFFECNSLEFIDIGIDSQLVEIGERSFEGCSAIKSIFIPRLVQSILSKAFYKNSALINVTFDHQSQCRLIATNAFYGCISLPSISFPSSLEEVGPKAFETCTSIENITFDEDCNLSVIQEDTFYGCINVRSLQIPASVRVVERGAFNGCSHLSSVSFMNGSRLTRIDDSTFANCRELVSVDFGDGKLLKTIGSSAFRSCSLIRKIVVSGSVEEIEKSAFEDCRSLEDIKFVGEPHLKGIRTQTFKNCILITQFMIPSSVTIIESLGFEGCSSLTSVNFETNSKFEKISEFSFKGCQQLKSIEFPSSLTTFEPNALYGCKSLALVSIGSNCEKYKVAKDSVTILNKEATVVVACPSASSDYEIEDTIVEIGPCAFFETSISSINLENITTVHNSAFEDSSIRRISIPNAKIIKSKAFKNCVNLEILNYCKFDEIGDEAFRGSENAFPYGGLMLSEKIERIGLNAFYGVRSLKEVRYCGFKEIIGSSFESDVKIIVGEDYEFNKFCGIKTKRVEGDACKGKTVPNLSYEHPLPILISNFLFDK